MFIMDLVRQTIAGCVSDFLDYKALCSQVSTAKEIVTFLILLTVIGYW